MTGAELGAIVGGAGAVYYATACAIWPYRRCVACKGNPKQPAWWGGNTYRLCGWCNGTGRRRRLGRWVFDHLFKRRNAS
jgi:hypothetical protein